MPSSSLRQKGLVKRSSLSNFARINKNGKIAINFREDDELVGVRLSEGGNQLIIGTKNASLVRFEEESLRPLGRTAAGVKGITLRAGDEVIGLDVVRPDSEEEILVVTDKGYGKRTTVTDYRVSNRGGMGIKTATLTERNGSLVYFATVTGDEDLMIVTDKGVIIRLDVNSISRTGRSTQGVKLIRLSDDQFVATVAKVEKEEEEVVAPQEENLTELSQEKMDAEIERENGHLVEETEEQTEEEETDIFEDSEDVDTLDSIRNQENN